MNGLETATQKLNSALNSLERALDGLLEQGGQPGLLRRELNAMIEDRANLAEQLDEALAREKELQSLADEASEALGAAIAEVRAALGREKQV